MAGRTAFVLGGGGILGAAEVGMLRALVDAGITPDLILGTSIGAMNGALLAADPTAAGARRLEAVWIHAVTDGPLGRSLRQRIGAIASSRARATSNPGPLRRLLAENLPERIEDLPVEFACVAASIERAAEHWFTDGPVVPAVLASSALPGLYPPVAIDGEHYLDGGLVNSIPLDRARKMGAERAFVLQVGRIEQPLVAPQKPWEVPIVAFEVARRARFTASLARSRALIEVHVLPTGGLAPGPTERANFDTFDTSRVAERIEAARIATSAYLADLAGSELSRTSGRADSAGVPDRPSEHGASGGHGGSGEHGGSGRHGGSGGHGGSGSSPKGPSASGGDSRPPWSP